ncbi:unnamed protein product [Echinostoma caproni]|uniref:Uncharacterized protein n=1 Tax=Echinostoma caproni TaxID=27848 RepID=A0A183AIU4_9TREM|nr:unnamed protein product [Echinostoma caproni]
MFCNLLQEYQKSEEDRQPNRQPSQQEQTNRTHTTSLRIPALGASRPESFGGLGSQISHNENGKNRSASIDSQHPGTDPDATAGDASSIGWSTSGSGCGPTGTPAGIDRTQTCGPFINELGCVSGRTDVKPSRHSRSVSDLERELDGDPNRTNCATSLTSLFSCTTNDKRAGEVVSSCQTMTSEQPERTRIKSRTRSLKKRLFGGGPSARRCHSRPIAHISAPFNVSVPAWVRASMNDLTKSVSDAHPTI